MVMFDFENKESPEYKGFALFVNTDTNEPRSINDIDKSLFPYPFVEKLDEEKIVTKENLLTKEECEYLIWLAESDDMWLGSIPFWNHRNLPLLNMLFGRPNATAFTQKLALDIHDRIKAFLSEAFGEEVYCDQIGIVRWPVGSWQMTHIDHVDGLDRVCGSVVFLNDDYEGGEPFHPYYGKKIKPKTGMIYAHDAGHSHLHGVTEIKNKTRYTIASTWTRNRNLGQYTSEMKHIQEFINSITLTDME